MTYPASFVTINAMKINWLIEYFCTTSIFALCVLNYKEKQQIIFFKFIFP